MRESRYKYVWTVFLYFYFFWFNAHLRYVDTLLLTPFSSMSLRLGSQYYVALPHCAMPHRSSQDRINFYLRSVMQRSTARQGECDIIVNPA